VVKNEYQLLADIIVGTATTNVDISSLNLVKGEEYIFVINYIPTSPSDIYIRINNNTTESNYYVQYLSFNGTTIASAKLNAPWLTGASNSSLNITKIKLTNNGYFMYQAHTVREYGGSGSYIYNFYGTSTFTSTSITSINLRSSAQIGIGSRIQLYKVGS
jgi:hypothetical protein